MYFSFRYGFYRSCITVVMHYCSFCFRQHFYKVIIINPLASCFIWHIIIRTLCATTVDTAVMSRFSIFSPTSYHKSIPGAMSANPMTKTDLLRWSLQESECGS